MGRVIRAGTDMLGVPVDIDIDDYAESGLRVGIFGSSGAGKGYLLGVIIEDMIASGVPTFMLDAEHELWTFKETGALVIGGAEGDAPFVENATALDAVIRYALGSATPIVFDVGEAAEADEGEAARLGELVLRRLWSVLDRERTEAFLAVTEASIFAPQQVPRGTHLPAVMRQMFQRGRKRGLMLAVETQRMADISKAVISQSNVSFYGRINKHTDYRAVERELDGRPYELMRNLPSGVFYVTPDATEVNVRPRRVTHGGGGPGAQIVIHERERVGLEAVLTLLRETASAPADESSEGAITRAPLRGADASAGASASVTIRAAQQAQYEAEQAMEAIEIEREDVARRLATERDARLAAEGAAETARAEADGLRERTETLDALAALLRRLVGDMTVTGADWSLDAVREVVRQEVALHGGPSVTVMPVEALRKQFLESAARRLYERVQALEPDQREALLFLLAHHGGVTINAVAMGISGNDAGNTRQRWARAVAALVTAELVRAMGSGAMKRQPRIDDWVRAALGPHDPTPEEIDLVRDRAIALLHESAG